LPNGLSSPSSPSAWIDWSFSAKATSALPSAHFLHHYHEERPHQGLDNKLIAPTTTVIGTVQITYREQAG
jgi:hypothetical protein